MMKVRSLRAHRNGFGHTFLKAKGDEYEHPHPAGDIACGIVTDAASTTTDEDDESTGVAAPPADGGGRRRKATK